MNDYTLYKSIQRAKRNAAKRAYLKPKANRDVSNVSRQEAAREYSERAQSAGIEPNRVVVTTGEVTKILGRVETTPTVTKPYRDLIKRKHEEFKNKRTVHKVEIARCPFYIGWLVFDGYDPRASFWIAHLDLIVRELRVSYTFATKQAALKEYLSKGEKMLWKNRVTYVGDER